MRYIKLYEEFGFVKKLFNNMDVHNEAKDSKQDKLAEFSAKWQKFEDDQPWEFDYFWSKIDAHYNDWYNRFQNRDNTDVEYDFSPINHGRSHQNRSDGTGGLNPKKDTDYSKRTGYIEAYIRTGGYQGGSCWDNEDNYARPYETYYTLEVDDLIKFLEHMLGQIIGENPMGNSLSQLMEELAKSNLIQEYDWTNWEYYGNSDDYRSYFITLWDLYVFLAKKRVF